jgi:acetyl esterase
MTATGLSCTHPTVRSPVEGKAHQGEQMKVLQSVRAQTIVLRVVFGLPSAVRRALAGRPITVDGPALNPDLQLLLRLMKIADEGMLAKTTPELSRAQMEIGSRLAAGRPIGGIATRQLTIPADHGGIGARLYTPDGLDDGSGLLVFYHGGGWVVGSLDSHDAVCRYLAVTSAVRVLSIDYRLAPEHPFPAGVSDAATAFRWAREHAFDLGADPAAIALGGDSAGGNLAAVTAQQAVAAGETAPAFLLLFYPGVDASVRRRSRELFGEGFYLTDESMDWFLDHYLSNPEEKTDPRVSPLLAADLSGMPATYLVTAGFDPLRDEGEAFAARLAEAGVSVVLKRQDDLIHGFISMLAIGHHCREALAEAAGALRDGLPLRARSVARDEQPTG